MNDFYNVEYMSERVAALAKERDELRREVYRLNDICERQARLNMVNAKLALDLDTVKAERDAAVADLTAYVTDQEAEACHFCKHFNGVKCTHKNGKYCFTEDVFWEWRGTGAKK